MRIRWRLALSGALLVALTMLLFGGALAGIAQNNAPTNHQQQLEAAASLVATELTGAAGLETLRTTPTPAFGPDVTDSQEIVTVLAFMTGDVIYRTGYLGGQSLETLPPALAGLIPEGGGATFAVSGTEVRAFGVPFETADGFAIVFAIQASSAIETELQGFTAAVWVAAIIAFFIALFASWVVSGRALRPLRRLVETADEITETGDLSRRLPPVRPKDEVRKLSESFNAMLDRVSSTQAQLEASIAAQQQFVADASHELRTPLTTIRNNAGFLVERPDIDPGDRAEAIRDIEAEANRMTALVEDLLSLARGDGSPETPHERLDLGQLTEAVVRASSRRRAEVELDVITDAHIRGDEKAIRGLVGILVDNAIKHGGAPVTVSVTAPDPDTCQVAVTDRGAGFPSSDLVKIFDRFYRADPARTAPGTGLGLAIARQISDDHGARIIAANRPGGGAVVEVTFPRARSV